ncbi:MAG: VanW family protein [Ardenticatenaceae bacterium]|nr:VanW family protein [Ardenticatenaceae bacterium]
MQANYPVTGKKSSWGTRLGWLSVGPMSALVVLLVILLLTLVSYQQRHDGRIYTGVYVNSIDLGELTPAEAANRLTAESGQIDGIPLTLVDPATGREWSLTSGDLGVSLDAAATAELAFQVGREGASGGQLEAIFDAWYYGLQVAPVVTLDEGQVFAQLDQIAGEVSQAPVNASIQIEGEQVSLQNSQVGRALDTANAYERLVPVLSNLQPARIELLVHESKPPIYDATAAAVDIGSILSGPMRFYLETPIDGIDLEPITVSADNLREWLRVRLVENEAGEAVYDLFIDEVALRGWLEAYADKVAREPENARFYFDDPTQELVLVEPHVNGRALDVDGTIALFNEQVKTPNRSVPLIINDILPAAHSGVTAAELGIKDLIGERTTWFYGSSNNRKHNIARAAANFYGIVVAPGEEFSFNKYIGDISLEEGYETGLVILGGQTIEGVGGGVCQVSTTLFQSVFWAGLDIGKRLEHGYRVGYYDDGEGPGMDATVYNPLVDFTFTNNTEHYLLIENYYNEQFESLTFKIYSTDIGRRVEKVGPFFDNVQEPPADEWNYNPELEPGEVRQLEFAAEGAQVTVQRVVYNFADEVRDQDNLISNYIPWGNVYEYGPDVNIDRLANWVFDELYIDGEVNIFEDRP